MKKLLLAVTLLGGVMGAYAQEEVCYAPKAGSFSTEIQFNPFSHDGVFSNGGVFSGAYFCTDKVAVMFDLGLGGVNEKYVTYDDPTSNSFKEVSNTRTYHGTFQLSLGAKYYFYNYKRVNLYAGAKVSYFHNFAGTKTTDKETGNWTWNNFYTPEPEVVGYTDNGDPIEVQGDPIKTSNGFGVYALTGINFNIYKGLYLGAEINVGFKDDILSGTKSKFKIDGVQEDSSVKEGGHKLNGGFNVTPTIILGWNF